MKLIRKFLAITAVCAALAACGSMNDKENGSEGSGSASETTPNDSSGAESRKAIGVGEDNQNDSLGYPSNQSNLNADSTRAKHD